MGWLKSLHLSYLVIQPEFYFRFYQLALYHPLFLFMTQAKKNKLITHLYNTQHKWLLAVAFNFTKSHDKAEELVQNLYVQLLGMDDLSKIIYQGDSLNQHYLYKILKSLFIKSTKHPNHPTITPAIEETHEGDSFMEDDGGIEHRIQGYISEALEQTDWFSRELWKTYCRENHSIVSLHEATKISTSTIWSNQQKLKRFVKEFVQEKIKQHE